MPNVRSAEGTLWGAFCRRMYALKRRLLCLTLLVLLIISCITDLNVQGENSYAPSMLGLCCGLLLGVLHLPEVGVVRDIPRALKIVAAVLLMIVTVYAATYPWHMFPGFEGRPRRMGKRWLMLSSLLVIASIYILCILKEHPPSTYAHDAKWCILGIWLSTMIYQFYEAAKAWKSTMWGDFGLAFAISVDSIVLGWVVIMFQSRIRVLRASSQGFNSKFWIYVMCSAFIANSICTAIQRGWSSHVGQWGSILVRTIFLTIWLTYTVIVSRTLSRGLHVLWVESRRVRGLPRQQVQWAARVLRMELMICASLGTTTFFVWSTINVVKLIQLLDPDEYDRIKMDVWFWVSILRRFDGVLNAVELALLSGILWQGSPPEEDVEMESRSRLRGLTSMSDFLEVSEQDLYRAKVEELAQRGFRLRSLIKFWEELLEGEVMPSFDPRRSQTNDVVRQAIIPSSRLGHGGFALASIWEEKPVLPKSMVTHNWTNTFVNLVAAMVSDALGGDCYANVADQLCSKSGVANLKQQLEEAGQTDVSFWVCAFSVNQHASICGGYGPEPAEGTPEWKVWDKKRHDSVSLQRFPLCSCNETKIFSHHDAACELNKFDDMMNYLSRRVDGFGQLIVIDESFEVLYRAWCVAEIVEANVLNIPARIKVYSQNAVDCNYDRLSLLDVRDCSASSQEDKDVILRKIVDVDAFNLKLQQLVFSSQGLFSHWVDGKERSRQVGRIWRRSSCSSRVFEDGDSICKDSGCGCCHFRSMFSPFRSDEGFEDQSETSDDCSSSS